MLKDSRHKRSLNLQENGIRVASLPGALAPAPTGRVGKLNGFCVDKHGSKLKAYNKERSWKMLNNSRYVRDH